MDGAGAGWGVKITNTGTSAFHWSVDSGFRQGIRAVRSYGLEPKESITTEVSQLEDVKLPGLGTSFRVAFGPKGSDRETWTVLDSSRHGNEAGIGPFLRQPPSHGAPKPSADVTSVVGAGKQWLATPPPLRQPLTGWWNRENPEQPFLNTPHRSRAHALFHALRASNLEFLATVAADGRRVADAFASAREHADLEIDRRVLGDVLYRGEPVEPLRAPDYAALRDKNGILESLGRELDARLEAYAEEAAERELARVSRPDPYADQRAREAELLATRQRPAIARPTRRTLIVSLDREQTIAEAFSPTPEQARGRPRPVRNVGDVGACEAVDMVPTADDAVARRCERAGRVILERTEFGGQRIRCVCTLHGYEDLPAEAVQAVAAVNAAAGALLIARAQNQRYMDRELDTYRRAKETAHEACARHGFVLSVANRSSPSGGPAFVVAFPPLPCPARAEKVLRDPVTGKPLQLTFREAGEALAGQVAEGIRQ